MEQLVIRRSSKKYGFNNNDKFNILRTIMGDCVLLVKDEHKPNIVITERKARYYGVLTGIPTIGGC